MWESQHGLDGLLNPASRAKGGRPSPAVWRSVRHTMSHSDDMKCSGESSIPALLRPHCLTHPWE